MHRLSPKEIGGSTGLRNKVVCPGPRNEHQPRAFGILPAGLKGILRSLAGLLGPASQAQGLWGEEEHRRQVWQQPAPPKGARHMPPSLAVTDFEH